MTEKKLKLIYAVRRYGPVGGMERYVWEVTRELAVLGHEVVVICERNYGEMPANIEIHELGEIAARPRWLALWRFGRRVSHWLDAHPHPGYVIQSNERLAYHDVTTFHGPPFATVRTKPWWKKISLRVAMQFYLERRELREARLIVPNSHFIRDQLAQYYPEYAHKLTAPIVPGVQAREKKTWKCPSAGAGVIGFIGKEWKRKGLPRAINVVAALRKHRPQLQFWVVGPAEAEIKHLFHDWPLGSYRLLGWRQDDHYLEEMDVLLHPAIAEPYGMVITEAMAAGLRVVISDVCGAASEVGPGAGQVVSLTAGDSEWQRALEGQLSQQEAPPGYAHSWNRVAQEFEALYQRCSDTM